MNEREFQFSIMATVRFSDLDSLGHVNNAVYLSYFEESRVQYFRRLLGLDDRDSTRLGIIVLEIRCTFKTPVYYGQTLKVFSRISWMKNKSMEMQYLATDVNDGRVVAEGSSILVAYDYSIRQTVEIPDATRLKIREFEKIPLRVD
jgi:acyl-CoA thioester hydrolase